MNRNDKYKVLESFGPYKRGQIIYLIEYHDPMMLENNYKFLGEKEKTPYWTSFKTIDGKVKFIEEVKGYVSDNRLLRIEE